MNDWNNCMLIIGNESNKCPYSYDIIWDNIQSGPPGDVSKWIKDNLGPVRIYATYGPISYGYFSSEEDIVLFKLRWLK